MADPNLYERIFNDVLAELNTIAAKYEVNTKAVQLKAIADDVTDILHTWSAQWTEDEE
ncbi:hypothetical protein KHQ84_gp140 [Rhodococcus phage Finch]|uniref:Uncharacterized protein n=1 Tax=Rhodococcus phage Finch TaxID=2094144 RepID=A0A2P1JXQ4_9CAUD|nr:hypothetical protein KHQ84_gp140 [Rhodococcus phage Finch]AVO25070.1 hypothetical protein SEA_FINCH_140 [Rhodococcus phage Finch]